MHKNDIEKQKEMERQRQHGHEIREDVKHFEAEEYLKKCLEKLRYMENQQNQLTTVATKYKTKVKERVTTRKVEKHEAFKVRQEHEARVILDKIREKRISAETEVENLRAKDKFKSQHAEQLKKERISAIDHYNKSNYGFERNEKYYHDRLTTNMKKQEAI